MLLAAVSSGYPLQFLFAAILSFICCHCVAKFHSWAGNKDFSLLKKRASHKTPTSRFGGLGAVVAFLFCLFFWHISFSWNLFFVLTPLFLIGIFEDLHKNIPVRIRLSVFFFAAVTYIAGGGDVLSGVGIDFIDHHAFAPLFLPALTVLCFVALINAFNFIDGVNGLSTGNLVIILIVICFISNSGAHSNFLNLIVIVMGVLVGLFFVNFPTGRVFMGDAGVYVFAAMTAVFLFDLEATNDDVSVWPIYLLVSWPATELIQTVLRRLVSHKRSDEPDMMHMHHVIMRGLEISYRAKKLDRSISNPLSTIVILPLASLPIALATIFYSSELLCSIFTFLFIAVYPLAQKTIVKLLKKKR